MLHSSPPSVMRWLQLLAACLTGLLIPLCFTGPAVVLPSIRADLGGTATQLSWIMNAYILSYGGAVMVSGSLTDIYGHRRIWLLGLAWFCAVTFAIPFMPSVLWIDSMRLLQGLGGAAAFAAAMTSLAPLFEGQARARAFSLLGTTFGLGLAFGPWVAGWIVESSNWQGVFYVTGAVGVVSMAVVMVSTSATHTNKGGALDWPGALGFTLALGLFTYGMLLIPEKGWLDSTVISVLMASAVVFAVFVYIERKTINPLLDLRFFKQPSFVGVQALAASPAFLFIALIVVLPGRFIGIDGYSALQAGQIMVWLAAPLLVVPVIAAVLTRWFTPGALSGVGLVIVALGLVWLAQVFSADVAHHQVQWPLLVIGVGIGLPWGLMDAMAVSVVSAERVGMATGIFNTVRVSADGVAIAIVSVLLATLIQHNLRLEVSALPVEVVMKGAGLAALGELQAATVLLPGAEAALAHSYAVSFVYVLYLLAGLALLIAGSVCILLRGSHNNSQSRLRSSDECVEN